MDSVLRTARVELVDDATSVSFTAAISTLFLLQFRRREILLDINLLLISRVQFV